MVEYRCPKCGSTDVIFDEIEHHKRWTALAGLLCKCGYTTGYFSSAEQLHEALKEWVPPKNNP
jgi:predicted nucleic-acid-binding Zn-ribbon protein